MVAAPPRSAQRSNGPAGWLAPSRIARSMSGSRPRPRARPISLVDDRQLDPLTIVAGCRVGTPRAAAALRSGSPAGRRSVEAAPVLRPSCPASTSRSWIGEGLNRWPAGRPAPEPAWMPGRPQVDVDADEIHQRERPHRIAGRPNRRIDLRDARLPGLEHRQRFERERPVDAVDDEARRVLGHDRRLAPASINSTARSPIAVRLRRTNDLDQRHDRGRIEEMQPEHVLRRPSRRDLGHGQGTRVGRQEALAAPPGRARGRSSA